VIGARRIGMPTVRLEVDFKAISKMGDRVTLSPRCAAARQCVAGARVACTGADGVVRMSARKPW
jgi:4-hydroxybenzoyl-CoA thioesterase